MCFLHIGPHKTASTTLQACLFANSGILQRAGYYVPAMEGVKSGSKHHQLAAEINTGEPTNYRHELTAELLNAGLPEKIVISSEGFSSQIHKSETRDRIAAFFHGLGYSVTILACIRPQIDLVSSHYAERTKKLDRVKNFDRYFEGYLQEPRSNHYERFAGIARDQRFEHVFLPFNSGLIRSGICQSFLACIGLDEQTVAACDFPAPRNQSPGPKTIAAFFAIHKKLKASGVTSDRMEILHAASLLRKMSNSMGWNETKYDGASQAQRDRLIQHFAASNDAFAKLVWNRPWHELFGEDENKAGHRQRRVFTPSAATEEERNEFDEFCAFAMQLFEGGSMPEPETGI